MFAPLSSQAQAVTDALRAFVLRVRPYKDAPPLSLSVEGGMHDLCSKSVRLESITLGAADGCDFVLLDDEIADIQARITVSYSLLGPLASVMAEGGNISVNGVQVSQGATSRHMQLPLELELVDGVTVFFKKYQKKRDALTGVERFMRRVTTTMALLGVATIGLIVWDTFYADKVVLASKRVLDLDGAIASSTIDLPTFEGKLAEMGLANTLNVEETSEGLFMVAGRLTPAQSKTWAQFAQWYDSVSFAKPMVVSLESTKELPTMPPVSMVRLSEPKEIFLKTGETIRINNVFSGDWTVAAIENDHIVISRGSDSEKLLFARPQK